MCRHDRPRTDSPSAADPPPRLAPLTDARLAELVGAERAAVAVAVVVARAGCASCGR